MKIFILFLLLFFIQIIPQDKFPKRELRGAWIATVANIDWPSSNLLSTYQQISELTNILDHLKEAGINSVFFQVRTECDALYESPFEPWSYWLTGEQGRKPDPFYDPLAFAIDEAHKRNIEFHAWLNPYRAVKNIDDYMQSENHISKTNPDWILTFDKHKMLNPGIPAVNDYLASVVADVVRRYDVDGIHFDDYFYPYTPIKNEDEETFEEYGYLFSDIKEWRRNNINSMIAQVYDSIKSIKSYVKFGVSPFAIIENKYAGTKGFEAYNTLYCDPQTWIKTGTVDYLVPQLYWEINHKAAPFEKLLPWWISVSKNINLFIGFFSSRLMAEDYSGSYSELGNQLRMSKNYDIKGSVFFSANSIYKNYSGFKDSLKNYYKFPAIIPAMPWIDNIPPLPPENIFVEEMEEGRMISWDIPDNGEDGETASYYILYKFNNEFEVDLENPEKILSILKENYFVDRSILNEEENIIYVVTSVDRLHNESIKGTGVEYP